MKICSRILAGAALCSLFINFNYFFILTPLFASPNVTINSHAANNVIITWLDAGSYALQTNYDPGTTNWGNYGGTIENSNGTNSVTIELPTGSQFFRLMAAGSPNVTEGLIGWWKFDEGSGTNVSDSSGNGNNGILMGNPTWVTGIVGTALSFNGNGQIVAILNTNLTEGLTNFSVTFWLSGTDFQQGDSASGNSQASFFAKIQNVGGTIDGQGWGGFNDSDGTSVRGYVQDVNNAVFEDPDITLPSTDGNWHFVVMEYNFPYNYPEGPPPVVTYFDLTTYGNGYEEDGGPVSAIGNADMLTIGGDLEGNDMSGSIDDFRVYNRLLTLQEMTNIFQWRGQP
jgi:hypothetical protein